MTSTSLPAAGPTPPAMPLALMFSSRLLLTEKASVTVNPFSLAVETETLTLRATMVTAILKEIQGYSHYGIND